MNWTTTVVGTYEEHGETVLETASNDPLDDLVTSPEDGRSDLVERRELFDEELQERVELRS